jgi:hypothetical protein
MSETRQNSPKVAVGRISDFVRRANELRARISTPAIPKVIRSAWMDR